jgi:hypothetical protein
MFKISNTQKVILDLLEEKHEIMLQCNPSTTLNTIDVGLAHKLHIPETQPRLITTEDSVTPVSNVEFTLEITSLDGEIKRVTGVADVTNHLHKDKNAIKVGSSLLKEINACIIM